MEQQQQQPNRGLIGVWMNIILIGVSIYLLFFGNPFSGTIKSSNVNQLGATTNKISVPDLGPHKSIITKGTKLVS